MQYCGGKHRISKGIIEAISPYREEGQLWIEPFVGSGAVITQVEGPRLGADIDEGLIALLVAVRDGYVPPSSIDRELYYHIKNNQEDFPLPLVNFVRFACSYGGKSWGGFASNKRGTNFADVGSRSLMKKGERLRGVDLIACSFEELEVPRGSLVYCDPPYQGTYNFGRTFDHDGFFDWCREVSFSGSPVFVSEYQAPEDFELIWEKESSLSIRQETNRERAIEKLFKAPSDRRDS